MGLDELIGGGFPSNTITLVYSPSTMRIKMAGGAGIITDTEGVVDSQIETMLKATVNNIVDLLPISVQFHQKALD